MGRGRAKAKQTKVARELKYNAPQTDLERLQQELSGGRTSTRVDEEPDPYGSWSDDDPRY
jgi:hypothetical protein